MLAQKCVCIDLCVLMVSMLNCRLITLVGDHRSVFIDSILMGRSLFQFIILSKLLHRKTFPISFPNIHLKFQTGFLLVK